MSFLVDTIKVSPNKPVHDAVQRKAILGLNDMDTKDNVIAAAARRSKSPNVPTAEPDSVRGVPAGTPNGFRSSPPVPAADSSMDIDPPHGPTRDGGDKSDSEAETIVLPGKDGHSPSKIRKSIKHEDRSEDEEMKDAADSRDADHEILPVQSESNAVSMLGKRKRSKHGVNDDNSHHSSGLSSVPTSPVATTRSSLSKPAASDSEISKSPSPRSRSRSAIRDKAKSVDRAFPRRKRSPSGSGDEVDNGFTKQRSAGDSKSTRDGRLAKHTTEPTPRKRTRSTSPQARSHKRTVSNQLPSKSGHGLSHKKKRVPAPLQSTEYHSDESSASGNSHPRSSRLRSLAAPITGDSTISPAKMAPHKKHVNSSGQTQLAIACNRGKLDAVKQRYEDRPDDLNIPDHAQNTPLHIASLQGSADIVKFLIDTGHCDLNPINFDKDAPLHDAVDNRHVEVVKLLLNAGANPSIPNKNQNDPLDLLNLMDDEDGDDGYEDEKEREAAKMEIAEMRKAISAAKRRYMDNRHGSEEHQMQDHGEGRKSHPEESPRQTTPAYESMASGPSNRRTVRGMMKTKERTLWMGYTVDELRAAATDGDIEFTNQFLQVKSEVNDPRTLYNAARGGHDAIINLLFALGQFNPDPAPLDGLPHEQATPILATIGRDDHVEVLKLFLGNSDFDPTRKIKGETYYEIAKRRAGPKWQEEEQILRDAFNAYQKSHRTTTKPRSPGLRRDGREADRDSKKAIRSDEVQGVRSHKRSASSPKVKDSDSNKIQPRSSSSLNQSKDGHAKRGPGRPKRDDGNALSDRETSPLGPPKQKPHLKKHESELTVNSDNEPAAKPRRKLVSGRELRDERELEKQRRASIASNASTTSLKDRRERLPNDPKVEKSDGKSSPNVSRTKLSSATHNERELAAERHSTDKDRARSLKRDDSKDRLSAIRSESPVKRPRNSETPPRSGMQEVTAAYDSSEAPKKRRKLDADSSVRKSDDASSSSPEHRTTMAKPPVSNENRKIIADAKNKPRSGQKFGEQHDAKDVNTVERTSPSQLTKVKLPVAPAEPPAKKPKLQQERPSADGTPRRSTSANSEEEEAQRQLQIRRQKKDAENLRAKELEEEKEREIKREKEREEEREKEKEREKERIEAARQARLAREQAEKEEQERREKEEAERVERQRVADAIAHAHAEEEARLRYEEQERLKREEAERRRAAHAEQQRAERARIEKEKREERLSKLPFLLKWFDTISKPNSTEVASLFKTIIGYRYDTIKPESQGQPAGREQWMLNIHAALLLGEKDLQLSRCKFSSIYVMASY